MAFTSIYRNTQADRSPASVSHLPMQVFPVQETWQRGFIYFLLPLDARTTTTRRYAHGL